MDLSWIKKIYKIIKTGLVRLFWPDGKNSESTQGDIHNQDKRLIAKLIPTRLPRFGQMKYLARFLSAAEKKQIKILSLVFLISILILSSSILMRNTETVAKAGGSYTEATVGAPQYINPVLASANDTDLDLIRLMYAGLLKYNNQLELEPDLAESYQISSDQKVYTFTLKKDLVWHDGKSLTASDVVFTIAAIRDAKISSPLEPAWRGVTAKQLDNYTIQFSLEKSFSGFLQNFTIGIIPEHIWQTIPPQNFKLAEVNLKPIGAGPWRFDNIKKDREGNIISYSLKSFSDYHGQKPYLKKFEFKIYPDLNSARQALLNKNVDGLSFISKEKKLALVTKKNIKIYNLQLPQYTAIFINKEKNEILSDIKVRKALSTAISKQRIVLEIYGGEAEQISGPILSGMPGFDPNAKNIEFNEENANNLLTEAGWQYQGGSAFRQKDEAKLNFTITTVDLEENIKTAELIRQAWKNIGAEVSLNIVPASSIQTEIIKPRNYELLLFGEILGSDSDLYPFWHSSQRKDPGLNLTSFSEKKADALLEQIRETFDWDEKVKKMQEFQKIINEQIPAIFLLQPTYSYPLSENIKGFTSQRINLTADRLIGVSDWYIKTTRKFKKN